MGRTKSTSELWGEVLVKVKELEKETRKTRLLMKETSDKAMAILIRVNATKKKNGGLKIFNGKRVEVGDLLSQEHQAMLRQEWQRVLHWRKANSGLRVIRGTKEG